MFSCVRTTVDDGREHPSLLKANGWEFVAFTKPIYGEGLPEVLGNMANFIWDTWEHGTACLGNTGTKFVKGFGGRGELK